MRGVRDDRFKLIETVVDGRRTTQLFDLEEDPWELHNLAEDPAQAERRNALGALLETFRTEHDDTRKQGQTFWNGYDQTRICREDSK